MAKEGLPSSDKKRTPINTAATIDIIPPAAVRWKNSAASSRALGKASKRERCRRKTGREEEEVLLPLARPGGEVNMMDLSRPLYCLSGNPSNRIREWNDMDVRWGCQSLLILSQEIENWWSQTCPFEGAPWWSLSRMKMNLWFTKRDVCAYVRMWAERSIPSLFFCVWNGRLTVFFSFRGVVENSKIVRWCSKEREKDVINSHAITTQQARRYTIHMNINMNINMYTISCRLRLLYSTSFDRSKFCIKMVNVLAGRQYQYQTIIDRSSKHSKLFQEPPPNEPL